MVKYIVDGGHRLGGEVQISGAKNAALAILPAALLADSPCRIENVPRISDVTVMLEILRELGAGVKLVGASTIEIDPRGVCKSSSASYDTMRKMRASYYIVGVMLGKFGSAMVGMPGGCDIGVRAIDQHLKGFRALGANVEVSSGHICAEAGSGGLSGAGIYLDTPSVGATMNIMLAAARTPGQTVIEGAGKEPHIVDLANFLNTMGANVRGAGTDVIKIQGVDSMSGCVYSIIPDQIEAGTYIAAAVATNSSIILRGVIPKHLECITAKFGEMGAAFEEDVNDPDAIRVFTSPVPQKSNVKTMPYPGFPTDMQPQITTTLCFAEGTSMVTETLYDNRFRYVDELKRMGANVSVDGKVAVVEGGRRLTGAPVRATDLRAGAALMIAALAADGSTEIEGVNFIERGYEDMIGKFTGLGAVIRQVIVADEPDTAAAV